MKIPEVRKRQNERSAAYYRTPEYKARERARYDKNPEMRDVRRERYRTDEDFRARQRFLKTGWSKDAFDIAWIAQQGCCAICSVEMSRTGNTKTSVSADHCHATNTPRALLCRRCNSVLGLMADSPSALQAAAEYVSIFSQTKRS